MFGLDENDLNTIQNKIDNQKKYLLSNYFTTSSGQVKNLLDVSFSANHSVRYYAQLSNKIDTMTCTAISQCLEPCFLTMTLDGYFRDLHQGDYKRFDMLSGEDMEIALKSVPKSDVLGNVRKKIEDREALSIKDLYNILNHQTKQFLQSYAFKKLRKDKKKYMYIRTVEPHKDGVPHFHMMLYIPAGHIEQFKKDFIKSYPAPRNKKPKAFQTDIVNGTNYIMKYILKSFMDVKSQKKIDYIQAWYVKYRIMRCVTSRALVPQWVYQKAYAFERDWYHLTEQLNDPLCDVEWSREDNYFNFKCAYSGRELVYQYGLYQVIYNDIVIKEMGEVREKKDKVKVYEKTPTTWTKNPPSPSPIYERTTTNYSGQYDKLIGYYYQGKNIMLKDSISPQYKSNEDLLYYFSTLDIDSCNLQHYMYIRNSLIDRGLINEFTEQKYNLQIHDEIKEMFEAEAKAVF